MGSPRLIVNCRPSPEPSKVHDSFVALNSHNLRKFSSLISYKWPNQSAGRDGFQLPSVTIIFAAPLKFRKLKVNELER